MGKFVEVVARKHNSIQRCSIVEKQRSWWCDDAGDLSCEVRRVGVRNHHETSRFISLLHAAAECAKAVAITPGETRTATFVSVVESRERRKSEIEWNCESRVSKNRGTVKRTSNRSTELILPGSNNHCRVSFSLTRSIISLSLTESINDLCCFAGISKASETLSWNSWFPNRVYNGKTKIKCTWIYERLYKRNFQKINYN